MEPHRATSFMEQPTPLVFVKKVNSYPSSTLFHFWFWGLLCMKGLLGNLGNFVLIPEVSGILPQTSGSLSQLNCPGVFEALFDADLRFVQSVSEQTFLDSALITF